MSGDEQGPKGAQDIGVRQGVEPKARPLPNVKSPFGPCKPPQLLLADENKALFLLRPVIVISGLDMKSEMLNTLQHQSRGSSVSII